MNFSGPQIVGTSENHHAMPICDTGGCGLLLAGALSSQD
jgi:hypothetical protein